MKSILGYCMAASQPVLEQLKRVRLQPVLE